MTTGYENIDQRLHGLLTGTYAAAEYGLELGRFNACADDRRLETLEIATLERAYELVIEPLSNYVIPVDRMAGFAYPKYAMLVRVGYAFTGRGDYSSDSDSHGAQTGRADRDAITRRAIMDARAIRSCLGSWRNTGALGPVHIIDCRPIDGGAVDYLADRVIVSTPFELWLREPLGAGANP